jgi:DNA mismatch repair protein MutL
VPVRILEDHVVNQIAAGEVVERPSSVVKELVENSLDAGARRIGVHLHGGGATRIRVVDDGRGMDRSDALACLERHATSKILVAEDLESISTLGFRGEALPAIASVSRFKLTTRPEADELGTALRVEGGRLKDVTDVGGPAGTEVDVRALFYNVPARRKFLRSTATEAGHAIDAVSRTALAHPDIAFLVTSDGRDVLHLPREDSRSARARAWVGPDGPGLLHSHAAVPGGRAEMLASPVGVHRSTAGGAISLLVNGRPVRDGMLRHAVSEAYRDLVPKGRSPVVVLWLDVDPVGVDVNVHPAKTEVRFRDPRSLQEAVTAGLRAALQEHGIRIPAPSWTPSLRPQMPLPVAASSPLMTPPPPPFVPAAAEPDATPFSPARPPASGAPLLPVPRFRDLTLIGQFARTYLLCEARGALVLVDQHAAHERVRLHQLQQDDRPPGRQRLLTPQRIDLGARRASVLEGAPEALDRIGLDVAHLAPGVVAVTAVPGSLQSADLADLLTDLADELGADGQHSATDLQNRALATMACHSAVRAGAELTALEMRALLASLDEVDFEVCAHGRPVAIRVDASEIERRFHRT